MHAKAVPLTFAALILCLTGAAPRPSTPPPGFCLIGELPADRQQAVVDRLTNDLKAAKAASAEVATAKFDSGKERKEAVARSAYRVKLLEAFIRAAKAGHRLARLLDADNLCVGDQGVLDFRVEISQVVDSTTALVWPEGDRDSGPFLLRGFDQSQNADGDLLSVSQPVAVTGTTAYTTVLGSKKTVLVIEAANE